MFRARGRQTRYDEGSVPGWLEAWGACQEAWRAPAGAAGAVEGVAEGAVEGVAEGAVEGVAEGVVEGANA